MHPTARLCSRDDVSTCKLEGCDFHLEIHFLTCALWRFLWTQQNMQYLHPALRLMNVYPIAVVLNQVSDFHGHILNLISVLCSHRQNLLFSSASVRTKSFLEASNFSCT